MKLVWSWSKKKIILCSSTAPLLQRLIYSTLVSFSTQCGCGLGKVSRKNVAVLLDFVQIRGGGGGGPAQFFFLKCIFGQ